MQNPSGGGTTTSLGSLEVSENLLKTLIQTKDLEKAIDNVRVQKILGILTKKGKATLGTIPKLTDRSAFCCKRYDFFLYAPFSISNQCCNVMKKSPAHRYARVTGRLPMTAQMASESRLRTQQWLKNGCNGFDMKSPVSNPMSFWTEQDVLLYILLKGLKIAPVYGDIVTQDGNIAVADEEYWHLGVFDETRPMLDTSGYQRTGCVFCGFGAHLEKGCGRFERLKETHPYLYDYLMRPWESEINFIDPETNETIKLKVQGLNYKEIIDWINSHGNLNIKY